MSEQERGEPLIIDIDALPGEVLPAFNPPVEPPLGWPEGHPPMLLVFHYLDGVTKQVSLLVRVQRPADSESKVVTVPIDLEWALQQCNLRRAVLERCFLILPHLSRAQVVSRATWLLENRVEYRKR